MQRMKDVMYDEKPEQVVVYPTSVRVLVDSEEVQEQDEMTGETSTKFKCTIDVYNVDEYIGSLQTQISTQDAQMTQTQLALVEVYEMLLG